MRSIDPFDYFFGPYVESIGQDNYTPHRDAARVWLIEGTDDGDERHIVPLWQFIEGTTTVHPFVSKIDTAMMDAHFSDAALCYLMWWYTYDLNQHAKYKSLGLPNTPVKFFNKNIRHDNIGTYDDVTADFIEYATDPSVREEYRARYENRVPLYHW